MGSEVGQKSLSGPVPSSKNRCLGPSQARKMLYGRPVLENRCLGLSRARKSLSWPGPNSNIAVCARPKLENHCMDIPCSKIVVWARPKLENRRLSPCRLENCSLSPSRPVLPQGLNEKSQNFFQKVAKFAKIFFTT